MESSKLVDSPRTSPWYGSVVGYGGYCAVGVIGGFADVTYPIIGLLPLNSSVLRMYRSLALVMGVEVWPLT